MPFNGGGSGSLPNHEHSSVPLDGGPLDFAGTTIGSMAQGSLTVSDGAALQELVIGGSGTALTSNGVTALWGAADSLYGAAKFTPIYGLKEYRTPLTGSAKHLQFNMSIQSNGYDASIQDLTLLHKEGKIR